MATIGLVVREGIKDAAELAREVIRWASDHRHDVILEESTAIHLQSKLPAIAPSELAKKTNPIVTLGGDGTLIGVARYVNENWPVLIGVNFGNLGFLTEISPSELFGTLSSVLDGTAKCGERRMLYAEVIRGGKCIFSSQAVNDVVVQKGATDRLFEADFSVDDEDVMRLRADGIIIATPAGSTAYSLAAGGSIVHPSLSVVLVTPVCPHSLTSRPFVLPLESTLKVRIPQFDGEIFAIVDGQVSTRLQENDIVQISKAKQTVRFAKSPSKSYFQILRTKLNWGIGNKAR